MQDEALGQQRLLSAYPSPPAEVRVLNCYTSSRWSKDQEQLHRQYPWMAAVAKQHQQQPQKQQETY
jgi:hypothetical protein